MVNEYALQFADPEPGDDEGSAGFKAPCGCRQWEATVDSLVTFLSMSAHELRTPLSSIIGFSDILLAGRAGELGGRQPEFLRVIRQAAEQMSQLVDDLVDMARGRRGELSLDLKEVDLPSLVSSAAGELEPMLAGAGVRLVNRVKLSVGSVEVDPNRLRRVLGNLLSYAVKSSEGGAVSVFAQRQPGEVVVRIAFGGTQTVAGSIDGDAGGIQCEDAVECTKASALVLVTSRYIVEAHGGRFWAEKQFGMCSAFVFSLPVCPP